MAPLTITETFILIHTPEVHWRQGGSYPRTQQQLTEGTGDRTTDASISGHCRSHCCPTTCRQLRLIALNTPQSGNMKGIRGPDYLCFEQARAAGLRGTFRAFLSSKVQDLHTIVRHSDREKPPIVNLKVRLLFDSWQSIFGESVSKMRKNVPIYSFDGRDILRDSAWPEKMVWHGSSKKGHRQTDQYCEAWRAGDQAVTGLASSLQSSHLLQQTPTSCSRACIVLCIENAMVSPSK
uniref:Collagen type XVIII alpha 1 chain a n=1 Tax=Oryzias latipes TaxID=8090 RepID=A0A3B3HGT3_ORYLA